MQSTRTLPALSLHSPCGLVEAGWDFKKTILASSDASDWNRLSKAFRLRGHGRFLLGIGRNERCAFNARTQIGLGIQDQGFKQKREQQRARFSEYTSVPENMVQGEHKQGANKQGSASTQRSGERRYRENASKSSTHEGGKEKRKTKTKYRSIQETTETFQKRETFDAPTPMSRCLYFYALPPVWHPLFIPMPPC